MELMPVISGSKQAIRDAYLRRPPNQTLTLVKS